MIKTPSVCCWCVRSTNVDSCGGPEPGSGATEKRIHWSGDGDDRPTNRKTGSVPRPQRPLLPPRRNARVWSPSQQLQPCAVCSLKTENIAVSDRNSKRVVCALLSLYFYVLLFARGEYTSCLWPIHVLL